MSAAGCHRFDFWCGICIVKYCSWEDEFGPPSLAFKVFFYCTESLTRLFLGISKSSSLPIAASPKVVLYQSQSSSVWNFAGPFQWWYAGWLFIKPRLKARQVVASPSDELRSLLWMLVVLPTVNSTFWNRFAYTNGPIKRASNVFGDSQALKSRGNVIHSGLENQCHR